MQKSLCDTRSEGKIEFSCSRCMMSSSRDWQSHHGWHGGHHTRKPCPCDLCINTPPLLRTFSTLDSGVCFDLEQVNVHGTCARWTSARTRDTNNIGHLSAQTSFCLGFFSTEATNVVSVTASVQLFSSYISLFTRFHVLPLGKARSL